MMEPRWLFTEIILEIHRIQIIENGGHSGVRDISLLNSALHSPKNIYHYENPKPSLERLAAAYAFHITKNHPFIDGNKRVSLVACELFLENNGKVLNASDDEKYSIFTKLAEGLSLEDLLSWLQIHVTAQEYI